MVSHRHALGLRKELVTALASCADTPLKTGTLRFLRGLSSDELQFIAGFMGGCLLEAAFGYRGRACARTPEPDPPRHPLTDREHKMILLREFLAIAQSRRPPAAPA